MAYLEDLIEIRQRLREEPRHWEESLDYLLLTLIDRERAEKSPAPPTETRESGSIGGEAVCKMCNASEVVLKALGHRYYCPMYKAEAGSESAGPSPQPATESLMTDERWAALEQESTQVPTRPSSQHHQAAIWNGLAVHGFALLIPEVGCPCWLCELIRVRGATQLMLTSVKPAWRPSEAQTTSAASSSRSGSSE